MAVVRARLADLAGEPWWAGLLLLAGLLRLVNFAHPPDDLHEFRQTQTLAMIRSYSRGAALWAPQGTWFGPVPKPAVLELPLFNVIAYVLSPLGGVLSGGRLAALACSLLAVLIFDRVCALRGHPRRRTATVMAALCPAAVFYGHAVQPEALLLALTLAAAWCALRAAAGSRAWVAAAGVCLSAAGSIKPTALLVLAPPVLYLAWKPGIRVRMVLILVMSAVGTGAWALFVRQLELQQNPDWYYANAGLEHLFGTVQMRLSPAFYEAVVLKNLYLLVGPLIALMVLVTAVARRGDAWWWWWLVGGAAAAFVFADLSQAHFYYLMLLIPAFAALASAYSPPWPASSVARLVLIGAFVAGGVLPLAALLHEEPIYVHAGAALAAATGPGEAVVVISREGRVQFFPSVLYYADRNGWSLPQTADDAAIEAATGSAACGMVIVFDDQHPRRTEPPSGWQGIRRTAEFVVARRQAAPCQSTAGSGRRLTDSTTARPMPNATSAVSWVAFRPPTTPGADSNAAMKRRPAE
jgi:hypothetical protein